MLNEPSSFTIQNVATGAYIFDTDNSSNNSIDISGSGYTSTNKLWKFTYEGFTGYYRIINFAYNTCIDNTNSTLIRATDASLTVTKTQLWIMLSVGNGYFLIQNLVTNISLAYVGNTILGASTTQDSTTSYWKLTAN